MGPRVHRGTSSAEAHHAQVNMYTCALYERRQLVSGFTICCPSSCAYKERSSEVLGLGCWCGLFWWLHNLESLVLQKVPGIIVSHNPRVSSE